MLNLNIGFKNFINKNENFIFKNVFLLYIMVNGFNGM